jgi:polyphosphate kinase
MNRNMLRRIELSWPVTDPALRQRLIDECLTMYLEDKVDAWTLDAKGHYQHPPLSRKSKKAAQARLMQLYAAKT